jgi:hypothetical protein
MARASFITSKCDSTRTPTTSFQRGVNAPAGVVEEFKVMVCNANCTLLFGKPSFCLHICSVSAPNRFCSSSNSRFD